MKKYIVIAAAALACLTACQGFLEEAPLTSQSDVLTLSTTEGINSAVGGAYAPLASKYWYGAEFIICNEMKTSNGKKSSTKDSGRLIDDYNVNYSPTNTYSGLWTYAYYVISCANTIIDKIGETKDAELNNYKAECLFLRAISHFDLVRTFAQAYNYTADASHLGVPIILHQDLAGLPARSTVKEVYDQIEADLLEAEGLISPSYKRSGTDPASSVSIYAIQALLSRVYLYSEQWQKAADYATKVIESGKYTMWTADDFISYSADGSEVSSVFWNDIQSDGEVIFEIYGNKSNSFDGYRDALSPMTTPEGYGDAGASMDIINIYEENDVRGWMFIEGDGDNAGDYWTAKYYGKGMANPDYNNTIVLRLSEMYLNRAEAIINGATSTSTATADMETVSSARGASAQPASKAGVWLERQKEFAWEGHLWFDLARTKRAITRTDLLGDVVKEIPAGDYRWAMPIPDHDISCNNNLIQNDGYSK